MIFQPAWMLSGPAMALSGGVVEGLPEGLTALSIKQST